MRTVLNERGLVDFERADLIAYADTDYYRLGERLGRFGSAHTTVK